MERVTGRVEPETGLPNPSLVAADWGGPKGVYYTSDGETVIRARNFEEVFEAFGPTLIVTESTFESYDTEAKRRVLDSAKRHGHDLRVISSRMAWKAGAKPDDDVASAKAIFVQAQVQHLKVPTYPVDRPMTKLQQYVRDRRAGWPNGSADLEAVAPYDELPDEYKVAFGDGKKYSDSLANAVFIAYEPGMTRDEYERAIGIYQHGYPSVFRSTIQRRNWDMKAHGFRVPKSVYRRGLRYLYHRMKQGQPNPETGLLEPA